MVDRLIRRHHEWRRTWKSRQEAQDPGIQLWEEARALVESHHGKRVDYDEQYHYPIGKVVADTVAIEGQEGEEATALFEIVGFVKGELLTGRRIRNERLDDEIVLQVPGTFEQCRLFPYGARIYTGDAYKNRFTLEDPKWHHASREELAEYRAGFDQVAVKHPLPATPPAQASL